MERVIDSSRPRRLILIGAVLAWLLFVASFLMPVTRDKSLVGWEAFWFYVTAMWDWQDFWRQIQREPAAILVSTFPATNALVFIAPVVLFRWPRWSCAVGAFLMFGGLVPLFLFTDMILGKELFVGFYCWVVSILLMALLCFVEWVRERRIRGCDSTTSCAGSTCPAPPGRPRN